ncbi:MAG: hypothetical protein MMC33_006621 [Icmadophila ericetorum]|nr:hypothetical protein [Icmadophila ericetorum]
MASLESQFAAALLLAQFCIALGINDQATVADSKSQGIPGIPMNLSPGDGNLSTPCRLQQPCEPSPVAKVRNFEAVESPTRTSSPSRYPEQLHASEAFAYNNGWLVYVIGNKISFEYEDAMFEFILTNPDLGSAFQWHPPYTLHPIPSAQRYRPPTTDEDSGEDSDSNSDSLMCDCDCIPCRSDDSLTLCSNCSQKISSPSPSTAPNTPSNLSFIAPHSGRYKIKPGFAVPQTEKIKDELWDLLKRIRNYGESTGLMARVCYF